MLCWLEVLEVYWPPLLFFLSLYITIMFELSDTFLSRFSCMYTHEDLFDTLYVIKMAALNVVGSCLIAF